MPIVGLSKPSALTPIDDAVHGSIGLTIFDRELVDHRYFQRLHFVLQNSVNYVAYPSNKNTRFPHSLGVAHMSSAMFSSALSNCTTETLSSFLEVAATFIVHLDSNLHESRKSGLIPNSESNGGCSKYQKGYRATIHGKSGFCHNPIPNNNGHARVLPTDEFGPEGNKLSAEFIVDTIWQSIRLYGLVHDIGHLPMSHAFENAIKNLPNTLGNFSKDAGLIQKARELSIKRRDDFTGLASTGKNDDYFSSFAKLLEVSTEQIKAVSEGKELHETRGISLYNIFISQHSKPSVNFDHPACAEIDKYSILVHHLTVSMILSSALSPSESDRVNKKVKISAHKYSFLLALRQLIDGEVDGDRIDYTIRDSIEAGLSTGIFDHSKLHKFSLLVSSEDQRVFSFGFFHRATDSVEQFFESRYQSYKYQIFNRTSFRSNKCVEELVSSILSFAFLFPNTELSDRIERYGYVLRGEGGEIVELLPVVSDFIEKIDDATLRSLLFELKELSSNDAIVEDLKQRSDGSYELSQIIRYLSDVVLFRDFSKISTLFKDKSLKNVVEKSSGSQLSQSHLNKIAVHLLRYSEDTIHVLRKRVWRRSLDELGYPVLILSASATAKVYHARVKAKNGKHYVGRIFEEETWVVSSDGDLKTLAERSPALSSMSKRAKNDRVSFVFAVGLDMKSRISKGMEIAEQEAMQLLSEITSEV